MSYTGRHRHKTAREKYNRDKRNVKVTLLFIAIAALLYAFMKRHQIIADIKTYFY